MVRDSFADLLDQRTPFGRLALVHVVMTAGDTLVTVSLAGSLFFSISPEAAKNRVILYLLLTMAPFAVVAPLLGPVIDRSRGARRATVVASSACRAVVCLIMAGGLRSLLLFPEAFTMLVLSKVYLVTKGSLVPLLLANRADGVGGRGPSASAASTADGLSVPYDAAAPTGPSPADAETSVDHNRLATANAQLGLLASLTAFAASLPAIAVLKLFGGPWVLRMDMLVFVVGTVLALRLPIRKEARAVHGSPTPQPAAMKSDATPWDPPGPLAALGPAANTHPEVTLALSAMSVLKGIAGFLTFMLAFDLRREHATIWYGPTLGLSIAGAVVGVLVVPRARRIFSEQQVLVLAVWLVALSAAMTAIVGGVPIQTVLAFVIGVAGGAGKPAFDALVQRYVPTAGQGRAFARFETRFQLIWVLGALLPVVSSTPLSAGDIVIAAVAGVGGLSYMTGRRAIRYLRAGAR
ncbi:MAG TPA: MFS transporter [Acidimicrobiales bacterium]|nr:MFS transporter [Acidimicrobiales bacterium]